jgi:phosphatidylserine/phosphatidylglycerophosphate/cardiolipin synthase-like enzyme
LIGALTIACTAIAVPRASADDQMYFPAVDHVSRDVLIPLINNERGTGARIDIATWYLSEHSISIAVSNAWAAGVPVRLIGDRGALFEGDPGTFPCTTSPSHTRCEFYWLANQGIPIRLRVNPTNYPEIMHWKAAIFAKQNKVLFGSGNFAPTELDPNSSTNFDDESEMVADDPVIVGAFRTKFDQMWNDTTQEPSVFATPNSPPYLQNWDQACAVEHTGKCSDYKTVYPNPVPMVIDTRRLEADNPMPPEMVWGQGTYSKVINGTVQEGLNNRMVTEINNESNHIELVVYRLTVANITNALLLKRQAGVPMRIIVDYPSGGATGQYARRFDTPAQSRRRHAHENADHDGVRQQRVVELCGHVAARPRLFHLLDGQAGGVPGDVGSLQHHVERQRQLRGVHPAAARCSHARRPDERIDWRHDHADVRLESRVVRDKL